jgi:hypothetical protein
MTGTGTIGDINAGGYCDDPYAPDADPTGPVLVAPEITERLRRQFGVSDRMPDIPMPEVVLDRASVMTITG